MNKSPRLSIPYIAESQAQKEVVHNEMVTRADMLIQSAVLAIQNDPPATPSEGDCYLISTAPTGEWVNKENHLTEYIGTSWIDLEPQEGWRLYNRQTGQTYCYTAGAWGAVSDIARRTVQLTAGTAAAQGVILYLSASGTYDLADNANIETTQDLVITISATETEAIVLEAGTVSCATSLTTGSPLYLGRAGQPTQIQPTASGSVVKCIGWAVGENIIKFRPDSFGVKLI